ncbi:amino acid ABC transporter permease [Asanoa sp. NPDC049573]|uniref:amino acid ABC transporter permease n=1 Tax=Asanoa sp. NPDC049573 TaxID=3155396 RepID=UPI003435A8D1
MSNNQTVLYDAPGPRARRITLAVSIVAAVLIVAGLYFFVYRPLDSRGEFSMDKWGPLVDPGNESFKLLWDRIWIGFKATLTAAGLAIAFSLVAGLLLAILRVQLKELARRDFTGPAGGLLKALSWTLNGITRACVEVFRGTPVVVTIAFCWLGFPAMGIDFDDVLWYLVIGLAIYNSVVIGEILRSGMEGLPRGQSEAARAIGLRSFQTTRLVLLPQAIRIMLPALISQLVVVLKDTSLGFIIGYEEILRVVTQVIQVLNNPIQMYLVVGAIYILLNYALSKLAEYIQHRMSRARRTAAPPVDAKMSAVVGMDAASGVGAGGAP